MGPRGVRPGCAGPLLPGALLRPVLLPGTGHVVLLLRRGRARRSHGRVDVRVWHESSHMVLVVPVYEQEQPGVLYNTAFVVDADGRYLGKYRKHHIPQVHGFWEKFYFRPGNLGFPVFQTAVGPIGVYICYDRHFPEGWRALGLERGDRSCSIRRPPAGASRSTSGSSSSRRPRLRTSTSSPPSTGSGSNRSETTTSTGPRMSVDPRGKLVGEAASDTGSEIDRPRSRPVADRAGAQHLGLLPRPATRGVSAISWHHEPTCHPRRDRRERDRLGSRPTCSSTPSA